jgi:hypothetical protein
MASMLRLALSIGAAGTRIADSVRKAHDLRDATTAAQRRQLVEQHSAARRAA